MESEQFQQALRRLEAAIERVERAAAVSPTGSDARFAALEQRHERLRDKAGEALARLDRLIDGAAG